MMNLKSLDVVHHEIRDSRLEELRTSVWEWLSPIEESGHIARPLLLANGVVVSVQASEHHSCELVEEPGDLEGYWLYKSFEVTFFNDPGFTSLTELWFERCALAEGDPVGKSYLWVPVFVVNELLSNCGGVVGVLISPTE